MLNFRPAATRGLTELPWLHSLHSFSFGGYRDPQFTRFGPLRVINEDRVVPGAGFDTHDHRDMEIITYVLSGALAHRDSMGNGTTINAGEWQKMSAGTGIEHSEFNASQTEPVHFYQIWIMPDRRGIAPNYAQIKPDPAARRNAWQLLAGPMDNPAAGIIPLAQDAKIYLADLGMMGAIDVPALPGRQTWLQVLRGSVKLGERELVAGDGIGFDTTQNIRASHDSELIYFDLPKV